MALWLLGYPEQALQQVSQAFAVAQELSSPFNRAFALGFAAWLHQFRREGVQAQERAETAIELSTEHGLPFWTAFARSLRGWAVAELGQKEQGILQLQQGLADYRAIGTVTLTPYHCTLLAETYGKKGQTEDGLVQLAEALTAAQSHEEGWWIAEVYRLKGELLLTQKGSRPQAEGCREKTEEAEECFLKALEIARKQQAKSLELRAVMSLARLWQSQGKQDDARQRLAEIYGWFTEGFDTKDLQEAKVLLAELSH
jgi:predicted ATPase